MGLRIHLDAVYQPGVPEGAVEPHATFNDQRRDPPAGQLLERVGQGLAPRDGQDFGSGTGEQIGLL